MNIKTAAIGAAILVACFLGALALQGCSLFGYTSTKDADAAKAEALKADQESAAAKLEAQKAAALAQQASDAAKVQEGSRKAIESQMAGIMNVIANTPDEDSRGILEDTLASMQQQLAAIKASEGKAHETVAAANMAAKSASDRVAAANQAVASINAELNAMAAQDAAAGQRLASGVTGALTTAGSFFPGGGPIAGAIGSLLTPFLLGTTGLGAWVAVRKSKQAADAQDLADKHEATANAALDIVKNTEHFGQAAIANNPQVAQQARVALAAKPEAFALLEQISSAVELARKQAAFSPPVQVDAASLAKAA